MRTNPSRLALFLVLCALSACRSEALDLSGSPTGRVDTTRGAPAPCSTYTDAVSCQKATGCVAYQCSQCSAAPLFAGCRSEADAPLGCPEIECPKQECAGLSQSQCELREECHAVFMSADTFSCEGCAPPFMACKDGPALCVGETCAITPMVCSFGYRVAYEPNGCEEGCVPESVCTFTHNDCRTTGCAPGLDCIQCSSLAWQCLSDCA